MRLLQVVVALYIGSFNQAGDRLSVRPSSVCVCAYACAYACARVHNGCKTMNEEVLVVEEEEEGLTSGRGSPH